MRITAALPLAESGKLSPMTLMEIHVWWEGQRYLGSAGLFLLSTLQPVLQELGFVSSGSQAFVVLFLVGFPALVLCGI